MKFEIRIALIITKQNKAITKTTLMCITIKTVYLLVY